MGKNILVGIDESEEAPVLLAAACKIAQVRNSSLTIVTVANIPDWASVYGADSSLREEGFNMYQPLLLRAQEEARKQRLNVKTELLFGNPGESIINYLKQNPFDLVVLGYKRRSNLNRRLLGSVASKVVNYSPCSVLIVRNKLVWNNILVALDASPDAARALELVFDLGAAKDISIEAVAVVPIPNYAGTLGEVETARQHGEKFYSEILAKAQWAAQKRKLHFRSQLFFGDPAERILHYLTQRHSDMVVLGHKGTSNIREILLGSTAYKLVNYSPCSVLITKI
jgi:nucleotide-binding universal stress UspA family protein